MTLYLKLLRWLCKIERKRMNRVDKYPYSRKYLIGMYDVLAISMLENPSKEKAMGICLSSAHHLENTDG